MLVNEGMTPIIYRAVERAISEHQPHLQTRFFRLHVEVDEQHVAELYRAAVAFSGHDLSDIAHSIDIGERGIAVILDEALGIFSADDSGHVRAEPDDWSKGQEPAELAVDQIPGEGGVVRQASFLAASQAYQAGAAHE